MEFENWQELSVIAKAWVREAGSRIRKSFEDKVDVQYKQSESDLVTEIDQNTEKFFSKRIKEHYPSHRMLGEEGFGDTIDNATGVIWIIDPIDGTTNFVHMKRHFAISVGIYYHGVGMIGIIYDVYSDEMYHAVKGKGAFFNGEKLPLLNELRVEEAVISMNATWALNKTKIDPSLLPPLVSAVRGVRSFGSAAIEMAYVASGKIDGYITLRLSPWDFAAGKILIEEVGGKVSTIEGKELQLLQQNTVFVGKPGFHDEVLKRFLIKEV